MFRDSLTPQETLPSGNCKVQTLQKDSFATGRASISTKSLPFLRCLPLSPQQDEVARSGSVIKKLSFLRSALAARSCDLPPDFSLAFGAIVCNPTPVGFGERSFQCGSFEVVTISWRSGLLPPGFVQITPVDRIETKIIDKL